MPTEKAAARLVGPGSSQESAESNKSPLTDCRNQAPKNQRLGIVSNQPVDAKLVFSILGQFPKLDLAGSIPVPRSIPAAIKGHLKGTSAAFLTEIRRGMSLFSGMVGSLSVPTEL